MRSAMSATITPSSSLFARAERGVVRGRFTSVAGRKRCPWSSVSQVSVPREVDFNGMLIPHQHHALLFESDAGEHVVVHFSIDDHGRSEVRWESLEEFVGDSRIDMVRRVPQPVGVKSLAVSEVFRRAQALTPGDYDLMRNNSEHFVTECLTGRRSSEEVDAFEDMFLPGACLGR
eukprot:TRINITY_DN2865_c1_g1_i3.p2 TRINITY_DN2865_c1_g1~~TRINITY_DN2865_c1_g1_i3.p2  ORF type:complete len:175 (+),score=53.82 TRINITY_DN2865_c1_g1_i3:224-748(+)